MVIHFLWNFADKNPPKLQFKNVLNNKIKMLPECIMNQIAKNSNRKNTHYMVFYSFFQFVFPSLNVSGSLWYCFLPSRLSWVSILQHRNYGKLPGHQWCNKAILDVQLYSSYYFLLLAYIWPNQVNGLKLYKSLFMWCVNLSYKFIFWK